MNEQNKPINITISLGTLFKIVGVFVLSMMVYYLRDLVLIVLTSVIIASAVENVTRRLTRFKIPRVPAVILIYVSFFLFIFAVLSLLLPPLFQDLSDLSSRLPETISSIGGSGTTIDPLSSITGGLAKSFSIRGLVIESQKYLTNLSASVFDTASAIFGGVFSFILILVISFYLSVQERGIESFLRIITPVKNESYILDLWKRSQAKIGLWFQGQILLGVIVGLLVFLGLTILQIKYALTLGILTAIFEIIPFFGPILSAVPGVLLGFAEGPGVGLMVIGLYIIVQQFENNLIYPLVVKKIIGVPPLLAILAIIIGAKLAGFLGIIVSVPLATILMELANDLEKRKAISKGQQLS